MNRIYTPGPADDAPARSDVVDRYQRNRHAPARRKAARFVFGDICDGQLHQARWM